MSNRKFVVARPTYTTYIKQYFLFFCRNLHGRFSFGTKLCFNGLLQEPITSSRLLRLLFIIGNHWMQSLLLWGGGGGIVQRLKMDIRHDEETDVFQGAWWQAISTPGSTSAIEVCRLQIWHDTIRTASTCKRNNFWNYKENVIAEKIRCHKAWQAAVNLIDGDREMEEKGKPIISWYTVNFRIHIHV